MWVMGNSARCLFCHNTRVKRKNQGHFYSETYFFRIFFGPGLEKYIQGYNLKQNLFFHKKHEKVDNSINSCYFYQLYIFSFTGRREINMDYLKKLSWALLIGFSTIFSLHASSDNGRIFVAPDARVELMSLVFRFAGNREYSQCGDPDYLTALEKHFAAFKQHEAIRLAREFHEKYGISYDAVASFAIFLNNTEKLEFLLPVDSDTSLDKRWPREKIPEFLSALKDFVRRSSFNEFFFANRFRYNEVCRQFDTVYSQIVVMPWLRKFFGDSRRVEMNLIPCFLVTGGYGCSIDIGGVFHYCTVAGANVKLKMDASPAIMQRVAAFTAHEFTHPNSNPWVLAHFPEMEKAAKRALEPVIEIQRRQAYGTAETLMSETFVRAIVAVYIQDTFGEKARKQQLKEDLENGFILVEPLYDCLISERQKGGKDWHFAQSGNRYVEVVNASLPIVEAYEKKQRELQENTPKIVKITPGNEATDIDPGVNAILVTFDRPMRDGCWSVVQVNPAFCPKITGKIHYDSTRTQLTIPVKLEPNHSYLLFLNLGSYNSFMSEQKYRLMDYRYTFRTGSPR